MKLARDYGYVPTFSDSLCMEWDDVIEYDGDGPSYEPTIIDSPAEQLIKYLKILFKEDEYVGYVTAMYGKTEMANGCLPKDTTIEQQESLYPF